MTSTSAVLAPVLLVLGFTLQGCLFAPYKPSVLVTIGKLCDKKVEDISDEMGLKEVLGGDQGCDALDYDLLAKLKVDDCATMLHELALFMMGTECEVATANNTNVSEACPAMDEDKDPEDCLPNVTAAVDDFVLFDESESQPPDEGFEVTLGLVQECAKTLTEKTSEDAFQDQVTSKCSGEASELDSDVMKAMAVTVEDCKDYLGSQFVEIGTVACVFAVSFRKDFPDTPDDMTYEWMQTAVQEITDPWLEEGGDAMEKVAAELPDPSPAGRLRLFASIRKGNLAGQLRRPWSAPAIAISASAGLALVALLAFAWRRRAAGQSEPQGEEPILGEEPQSVA